MDLSKFRVPQRYAAQEASVWVEYAALAAKYKPINLGQGFPDFAAPEIVSKSLIDVARDPNLMLQQYTRDFGHPRLVKALARLYGQLSGHKDLNPLTEVLVTCGAYEALYCTISGHVEQGDEVIIIEPYFDCYEPMVLSSGGVPKYVPLHPSGDKANEWKLDKAELESAFNKRTKMIIVNTPHNPLGKVFTREELEHIAELCKKWDVLFVADEVYEWLVYEPQVHVRTCTLPGMWERTITIGSAGKTFSVTGWKTGWAYGPKELMQNLFTVHQNCIYTNNTPTQEAVARAFEYAIPLIGSKDCMLTSLAGDLLPKRDFMASMLRGIGLKPVVPQGGYFMLADWSPVAKSCDLSREEDRYKDFKFTKWLTKNVGVQGIPPSAFYSSQHKYLGEDYIRLCFIKEDKNLKKAADALRKWKSSKL